MTQDLQAFTGSRFELFQTQFPAHATSLATKAVVDRASLVIVVGGDGTINEVVNGMMQGPKLAGSSCKLGIINCGSGADFVRSLYPTARPPQNINALLQGPARLVDLGLARFRDSAGQWQERYFINESSIGISSAVVKNLSATLKRVHPGIAFAFAALTQLGAYPGFKVNLVIDSGPEIEEKIIGLAMANGRFAGGGMQLAPEAVLDDGVLDVIRVRDMTFIQRLNTFLKIYSGKHIHSRGTVAAKARQISIQTNVPIPLELDGELVGSTPCTIKTSPHALWVKG